MRLVHHIVADIEVGEGSNLAPLLLLWPAFGALRAVYVAACDDGDFDFRILEAAGKRQRINAAFAVLRRSRTQLVKRRLHALVLKRLAHAFAARRAAGKHQNAPSVLLPANEVGAHVVRPPAVIARAHAAHLGEQRRLQLFHRAQNRRQREHSRLPHRRKRLVLCQHQVLLFGQGLAAFQRRRNRLVKFARPAVHAGKERFRLVEHDNRAIHVIQNRLRLSVEQVDEFFKHAVAHTVLHLADRRAQFFTEAFHRAVFSRKNFRRGDFAVLQRQIRQRRFVVFLGSAFLGGGFLPRQRFQQQAGKLFRSLLRHGRFAGGRDDNLLHVALAALAHHVNRADGIQLVVKKLDAHRAQRVGGVYVDDPAAHGELPLALDHVFARVTRRKQPLDELVNRRHVAHAQRNGVSVKRLARHHAMEQRVRRGDDRARIAAQNLAHRLNAAVSHLAAGRHILIEGDFPCGEQAHAAAQQRGKILHRLRRAAFAVAQEKQRSARPRGQRAGRVRLLRARHAAGRDHRAALLAFLHHLLKRLVAFKHIKEKMRLHDSSFTMGLCPSPGNSHSCANAPCDFRFPPCFFPHSGRMASIPQRGTEFPAPSASLRAYSS